MWCVTISHVNKLFYSPIVPENGLFRLLPEA